jgi:putative SOS response-associated peptidase YedK
MAELAKRFGIELAEIIDVRPRYNLAPSEDSPAVVREKGKKRIKMMSWGLKRQWDKGKPPRFIINLTVEKLATGPFKSLVAKRRCLIPADGFYEWKAEGKKKLPFRFTLKDDSIFAFPAIYDDPTPNAGTPKLHAALTPLPTFCIFTTPANSIVSPIHHRMPAILPREWEDTWLDPDLDLPRAIALLAPYPPEKMKSWAVSPAINSAKIDNPEVIKPL